jgi:hypothetical protein
MATEKYAISKSIFAGILIAVGLFSTAVFLGNSWIKLFVIVLIVISGIAWLVSHGLLKHVFKYMILAVMVFAILFSGLEGYLLWNAGYPPTTGSSQSAVTISYPNILNMSLTEIVQSVKNTPTFNLIMIEHLGEVAIETMTLDTTFSGGRIQVILYQDSSNLGITFASSSGGSYHASVASWGGTPLSQMYPQQQTPDDILKQIDTLGLNWYYNRAVEAYQNETGTTPEINALQVSVQWDNYATYQGMTLQLIGSYESNSKGHSVFIASFQPDGTLNYLTTST